MSLCFQMICVFTFLEEDSSCHSGTCPVWTVQVIYADCLLLRVTPSDFCNLEASQVHKSKCSWRGLKAVIQIFCTRRLSTSPSADLWPLKDALIALSKNGQQRRQSGFKQHTDIGGCVWSGGRFLIFPLGGIWWPRCCLRSSFFGFRVAAGGGCRSVKVCYCSHNRVLSPSSAPNGFWLHAKGLARTQLSPTTGATFRFHLPTILSVRLALSFWENESQNTLTPPLISLLNSEQ